MQNLFTKIRCVSWNKLFFSCSFVCISMTRAFWLVRFRKQSRYTGFRRHREVCTKSVYWLSTPRGSLRKAGIPASDVLRVNVLPPADCIRMVGRNHRYSPYQRKANRSGSGTRTLEQSCNTARTGTVHPRMHLKFFF